MTKQVEICFKAIYSYNTGSAGRVWLEGASESSRSWRRKSEAGGRTRSSESEIGLQNCNLNPKYIALFVNASFFFLPFENFTVHRDHTGRGLAKAGRASRHPPHFHRAPGLCLAIYIYLQNLHSNNPEPDSFFLYKYCLSSTFCCLSINFHPPTQASFEIYHCLLEGMGLRTSLIATCLF